MHIATDKMNTLRCWSSLDGQYTYCRTQVRYSNRIDRFQGIQNAKETGETKLVRGFSSGFVEKCNYRFASKISLCSIDLAVVCERLCSPSAFLISDFLPDGNVTESPEDINVNSLIFKRKMQRILSLLQ